jgi:hypothetical protein
MGLVGSYHIFSKPNSTLKIIEPIKCRFFLRKCDKINRNPMAP